MCPDRRFFIYFENSRGEERMRKVSARAQVEGAIPAFTWCDSGKASVRMVDPWD